MEVNINTQEVTERILDAAPASSTSSTDIKVVAVPAAVIDATFSDSTNLSTSVLGAKVLSFSDEYFASAVQPSHTHTCNSQARRVSCIPERGMMAGRQEDTTRKSMIGW